MVIEVGILFCLDQGICIRNEPSVENFVLVIIIGFWLEVKKSRSKMPLFVEILVRIDRYNFLDRLIVFV